MGLEFPILFVVVNLYCEFWNRLLHASSLLVSFYSRLLLAEPAEILLDVYFSIFVFPLLGHISLNLNWLIVCLLCMGFPLYVYAWISSHHATNFYIGFLLSWLSLSRLRSNHFLIFVFLVLDVLFIFVFSLNPLTTFKSKIND